MHVFVSKTDIPCPLVEENSARSPMKTTLTFIVTSLISSKLLIQGVTEHAYVLNNLS